MHAYNFCSQHNKANQDNSKEHYFITFIYHCRSILMPLWAPELLFWGFSITSFVCMCMSVHRSCWRGCLLDSASVHELHTHFSTCPKGMTICFIQQKQYHKKTSLWGNWIHFACKGGKCWRDFNMTAPIHFSRSLKGFLLVIIRFPITFHCMSKYLHDIGVYSVPWCHGVFPWLHFT